MIDLTERYELIKAISERLKEQPNKPKLRIGNQRRVITSHKPKVRKILHGVDKNCDMRF